MSNNLSYFPKFPTCAIPMPPVTIATVLVANGIFVAFLLTCHSLPQERYILQCIDAFFWL